MKQKRYSKSRFFKSVFQDDRGAIAAWFALMLPVFIGITALAVDVSYGMMMRHKSQVTASAAALAGAGGLTIDNTEARARAKEYALDNMPGRGDVLPDADIELGTWTFGSPGVPGVFANGAVDPDPDDPDDGIFSAVRVTTRLTESNDNPITFFLAGIFGMNTANINTTATAITYPNPGPLNCIISLNDDPDYIGLDLGGNSTINAPNCGICVNSENPNQGMDANGNPTINVEGGGIYVAGGYREVGSVEVDPNPIDDMMQYFADGQDLLCEDPFNEPDEVAELAPYEEVMDEIELDTSVCDSSDGTVDVNGTPYPVNPTPLENQTITHPILGTVSNGRRYLPGIYCGATGGIDIQAGTPVQFDAGNFYLYETSFDVNGVSGSGVFVQSEVDYSDQTGGNTFVLDKTLVSIENSSNFNLVGTLVDEKPGFLFYQMPSCPDTCVSPNDNSTYHNINGGSDFFMSGTIYLGDEDLRVRGDIDAYEDLINSECLAIIAGTIDMNGTVDVNLENADCGFTSSEGPTFLTLRIVD